MKATDIPVKIEKAFAAEAGVSYTHQVPVGSQIGITDGAASFTTGFPPLCFSPLGAGGVPPFGKDFNGVLQMISAWTKWQGAGGVVPWDSALSAAIGGYPVGAIVIADVLGYFWLCTVDDNVTDPDAGGAGWVSFSLYGTMTTGDFKLTLKDVADPGFVMCDDGTIGNAASLATTLASALAQALYVLIWTKVSNTWAPVMTGRGLFAIDDFNAGKPMALTKMLGRAIAIAGSGAGLTARALGQILGGETSVIGQTNLPNVNFIVSWSGNTSDLASLTWRGRNAPFIAGNNGVALVEGNPNTNAVSPFLDSNTLSVSGSGTAASGGSATPLSIMPPESFVRAMLKL